MSILYTAAVSVVEKELDLEEENFIQSSEMLEFFNKARRETEAIVLGIYEDYLLDSAPLSISTGTSKYNLPSGIYASKIRAIIYSNGSIVYEIRRIRSVKKFLERACLIITDPTNYYRYIMLNSLASGIQLELSPPATETSSTNVVIWYLRKIPDLTGVALDYVDKEIPESINYIYSYVKGLCKQKENGGTMPADAAAEIARQEKLLVDTLTNMIPDDDNEVIKDMQIYDETS